MYKLLCFLLINASYGIIPKYKFNKKNPLNDLSSITKNTASIISRNWLSLVLSNVYDDNSILINYDDHPNCHIIKAINKQESYIQNNEDMKYMT